MATTGFAQLSDDLHAAIGFDLPIRDEWRTWEHALAVPLHDDWLHDALQLSVQPARGRNPARIGASMVINSQARHFTIAAAHAPILIEWADAGATGVPACVSSGEAVEAQ